MNNNLSRRIAIFTDAHALLEPTRAILEDIKRRNITEIYSLGDNIGEGPNPSEVINLLEEYNVISLAGNAEDYITLGTEPFRYLNKQRCDGALWTESKLNNHQKEFIAKFPHSLELLIKDKKIALCHFANDVRFDYGTNNSTTYYEHSFLGKAYEQFLVTNSPEQIEKMQSVLSANGKDSPQMRGFVSALNEPLFNGKTVDDFDAIIEGHVHYKVYEKGPKTEFYTLRGAGIGYSFRDNEVDNASYVILTETDNGFILEEVLVKYDREQMEYNILNSDIPFTRIRSYTRLKN